MCKHAGSDRVLFAERTGELQYVARLSGRRGAVAKASLKRAWAFGPKSYAVDPKPGELPMARVKRS